MGYNEPETQGIAARWRGEFPVTNNLIYLNHAAVAPLPRRAAEAMQRQAEDACLHGSLHYPEWMAACDGVREATARMVNAEAGEIALVKNTSEGIATVALGFPWKAGDRIVAFHEEFPANYYIWKKLEETKGVRVEWLSCFDGLEKVEAAARGARFLAISFVQYLSGFRPISRRSGRSAGGGGLLLRGRDSGSGGVSVRRAAMQVDAFAADGHKWLLGPEGAGVLYIAKEWQDRIEPVEFGWTNVAGWADYASRDMTLRKDAGRYEPGTLNVIGSFGLRASMELLLEVGIPAVSKAIVAVTDRLAEGARAKGYEVLGERKPETAAGIVCLRKPGVDARVTHAHLRDRGMFGAPRQGWVRLSPHFYVSLEDADRVVEALP